MCAISITSCVYVLETFTSKQILLSNTDPGGRICAKQSALMIGPKILSDCDFGVDTIILDKYGHEGRYSILSGYKYNV